MKTAPGNGLVFEYSTGAEELPEQPEVIANVPMSLWHLGLELHVGRCYSPFLGPLSSLFVFIWGTLSVLVIISGYIIYKRRQKKFNYNYVHLMGRTVDSQFSQPRPSSATWRIDYDHQFCTAYGLNVAISGRFLSEPDTDQEKHDTAYQIWKFTLQQRLFDGISINFNIDNLFNYVPKAYYWSSCMTKGRTWSLGISMDVDRFVKAVKK